MNFRAILVKTHSVVGPKSPSRRGLAYPLASKEFDLKGQDVVDCRAKIYKAHFKSPYFAQTQKTAKNASSLYGDPDFSVP